jgi:predicted permease
MLLARRILQRIRAVLRRRTLENEMQAELREHLDRATERFVARGMSVDDARLAARREFGNVAGIEEEARDARGARWVDALAGDARFALRYFARHKSTVAIIVAVLSLGVGANTLIFAVFQAMFLRPAPAVPTDAGQVRLWVSERATKTAPAIPHDLTRRELTALAEHREIFEAVAAWTSDDVILDGGDSTGARGVHAQFVTPNYFTTLGVPLAAGQGFAPDDNGAPDLTAVMSYPMAALLYGSDGVKTAVGRRILVNEMPVRVVGVAPRRFQGALRDMGQPALWIPLSARAGIARVPARWMDDQPTLSIFARLTPDASRDRAAALARQVVANTLPDSAPRVGMSRTAYILTMREEPPGSARMEAILVFSAVAAIGGLILLVAWMNVSSLMVAAAVARRHEIAVRLSLGASRVRLVRQLVTESTLLALAGGATGLTVAWWVLTWLSTTSLEDVNIAPDAATFAFVFALALATGIVFGLSPALHATRADVATALRDSGTGTRRRSRLQRIFVALQIMLSQPLLVLLGAVLTAVIAEYTPRAPEMSQRVIAVELRPLTKTGGVAQRPEAVDSLVPRIAERPEVQNVVSDATAFAIRGIVAADRIARNVPADTAPSIVHVEGAAPGWFALVDVPIMLGRDVSLADTAAADYPVVIASDFARARWGDGNPIGRHLPSPPLPGLAQDSIQMTVVGVYDASRALPRLTWNGGTARGDQPSRIYTAHGKQWRHDRILVRTRGPAEPFLPTLQRFIRRAAPSLPVSSMETFAQTDAREYRVTVRVALLAGAAGALALLLASLGLYGVVSLAVQQRTREIGIRIAVGAQPMRVARMFLVSGVRVSVIALVLGLPLSVLGLHVAITRGALIVPKMNASLIGAGIAVLLLLVAAAATWIPARRAALVDPATTLRVE